MTTFPKKNNWQSDDNRNLWLNIVGQVMVVGGSAGYGRFLERKDLQKQIGFNRLKSLTEYQLRITINTVLREAGVRYAQKNPDKCHKTSALVHNYQFIRNFRGGFKGLLKQLADIKGPDAEHQRVEYLMRYLKFIKNKSARDFLMERGVNKKTIAIDIRIKNTFEHFGVKFPSQTQLARNSVYRPIEQEIIQKVCRPLGVVPMKFDRILYQNYDRIVEKKRKSSK